MKNYFMKHLQIIFAMLFVSMMVSAIHAQTIKITGTVTDDTGMTVIGAAIKVKGSNKGTVTDIDGNYKLKVDQNDRVLVFSYMGLRTQNVAIKNRTKIDVVMSTDSKMLEDVVVIGYGSVRKKEVTGAVAQIKSDDISKYVTADLGNALQGQVSGVNVVAGSGEPGEGSQILIRGISSVSGSNTPLYVVDGVPQEGDPRLSTNEIQSIDVLKDAASCAIYGTRGAAGVILITTKQGKSGKMAISLNTSYGIQHVDNTMPLLNAEEQTYADILKFYNLQGVSYDEANLNLRKLTSNFYSDEDYLSKVFNNDAAVQNYSLNLSGGNKTTKYNVTAGWYDADGVIINSNFQRFNTRANVAYSKDRLTINASLSLSSEDRNRAAGSMINSALRYNPTRGKIDLSGNSDFELANGNELSSLQSLVAAFSSIDKEHRDVSSSNFNLQYRLAQGLQFSSRLGLSYIHSRRQKFSPSYKVYLSDGEDKTDPTKSYSMMINADRMSLSYDAGLTYKKTLGKNHLTAMAVVTTERYKFNGFTAGRQGIINNQINVINGGSINPSASSADNYVNTLFGSIGRLQYDWDGRYLISASLRCDGSSKFAKENRWGYFPSVSTAWNVADEAFWKPLRSTINSFKLRGSYGTTGNQNFDAYSAAASIVSGYDAVLSNNGTKSVQYGSAMDTYANPTVKWETTKQINIGFDMGMLDNRITVSAEYYRSDKSDMLFPIVPANSSGTFNNVIMNIGNMVNKGVELSVGYRDNWSGVKWGSNFTFSTNENEITKINGLGGYTMTDDSGLIIGSKDYSQCTAIAEGYEAGAFFLYKTNGVIKNDEQLTAYKKIVPTAKLGDLRYIDTNNDGKISNLDRTYCGSGLPDYEIGYNFDASYHNFDFSMNWYAALGHEIMNGAKAVAYSEGRAKGLLYQWSPSNTNSDIPSYRGNAKSDENYRGYTDYWLEKGDYLRLKNVTLGYTLPKSISRKLSISSLRFYLTGQNLLTFTEYTGYDPEVGGSIKNRGLDKGNYPVSAMYIIGANINF